MKPVLALLASAGLATAVAVGPTPDRAETRAVVTLGAIESPTPTPRVRITNRRIESVEIAYLEAGAQVAHKVGEVAGRTTSTFGLPNATRVVRLLIRPMTSAEWLVTQRVEIVPATDLSLAVADPLAETRLEVDKVQVVWNR